MSKHVKFSTDSKGGLDPTEQSSEVFTTSLAFTPKLQKVLYKSPKQRESGVLAPPSTIARPNYDDILRRVSVIIHQHIRKCEALVSRLAPENSETGLFHRSKMNIFSEDNYISPQYVYHFVRAPVLRFGFCYGIRKLQRSNENPSPDEVYTFLRTLFVKAQLSPECSIVCLIYVERLMEKSNVPLVTQTWRPCLLCGLLLASKVWQDLRYTKTYFLAYINTFCTYRYTTFHMISCLVILVVRGTVRSPKSIHNSHFQVSTALSDNFA